MNGKIQGIIIGGVVVAALGGTLAFLQLTGKDSGSADSSSSQAVVSRVSEESEHAPIISLDAADIIQVEVANESGGFTVERPSSGKTAINVKELTGLNQNIQTLSGLMTDLASLEGFKTVEESAADLAKYGLSETKNTFELTLKDNSKRKFRIGDVATKTRYRYLCEDGSKKVYMVATANLNTMLGSKEELVARTLIGSQPAGGYGRLEITRKDLDYTVAFEDIDEDKAVISSQVMVEPIFAHLNITYSSDVTHGMFGLTAGACTQIFPTDEQKAEYGLSDPLGKVHYKNGDIEFTIIMGKARHALDENGKELDQIASYYCYVEGISGADCIWEIPAESLPWATFLPGDVISLMTSNKIFDINAVDITTGSGKKAYTLDGNEDDNAVYWVKESGKDVDVELFKDLYKYILSFPTREIYFDKIEGDPFITIEITRKDGGGDKVEFFKDSSRRVLVKLNGRPSYKVESRWTDTLLENIEHLQKGEPLKENA